jgi:hypothetical protein
VGLAFYIHVTYSPGAMSNSTEPSKPATRPLPDPLPSNDEAFKAFMAAMDQVFYATQVMVAAARKEASETAFRAGLDAYKQWIEEQVRRFQAESPVGAATVASPLEDASEQTANDRVLLSITAHPGRRGVDIANEFSRAPQPLPERTVRTALHRLKNAKKIMPVAGLWYTWDIGQTRMHQRPQRIPEAAE